MPSAIPGPTASTPLLQAQAASSSAAARRSPSPSPSQSHRQSYHTPPSPLLLPRRRRRRSPTPRFPLVPTIVIFGTFALIAFAAWDVSSIGNCYFPGLCRALGKGKGIKEDVWQRNIGSYAPYRSQGEGGGKHNLPRGCEINQVNIVSLAKDALSESKLAYLPVASSCRSISHVRGRGRDEGITSKDC